MQTGHAIRLRKQVYRFVVGPPVVDLVRTWTGTATAAEGMPVLRHLHIGDCNFRRMDLAHDTHAAPGYPLVAAQAIQRKGVGVEFAYYFAVNFDYLPERDELLNHVKLGGAPDVISVQIGASYSRWIVLPDTNRTMQLRVELGRRAGRRVALGYRLLRPLVRLFGRPAARYGGTEGFERFLALLAEMWPESAIVLVLPYPRCTNIRRQLAIDGRVDADLRTLANRIASPVLDSTAMLGRDRTLRGASAYHLNGLGSELLGEELARLMLQASSALVVLA
jgi:hypothetical protein